MKKSLFMLLTLILMLMFASCSDTNNNSEDKRSALVCVLRTSTKDYWKQIAYGFEQYCKGKGYTSLIYFTTDEDAYDEQVEIINELHKQNYDIKGIAIAPCWSAENHQVEQTVADYAKKYQVPVVLVDTPVDEANSPLNGIYRSYVGTDNRTAGEQIGNNLSNVKSENILVVRLASSTVTLDRYEGMCDVKGNLKVWATTLDDVVNIETELSDEITDIVFLNGSLLRPVLNKLEGRNVHVFDVYKEFLDLFQSNTALNNIIAQNTLEMGKQAANDLITKSTINKLHFIPTINITRENINSIEVYPFKYYFQQEKEPFIAAVIGAKNDTYFQWMANDLVVTAVSKGENIRMFMIDNANDNSTQANELNELIRFRKQLKGLVFCPITSDAEIAAAETIEKTGATLVLIDSSVDKDSPIYNLYTAAVLTDNITESVNLYKEAQQSHDKILVVYQTKTPTATERYEAVKNYAGNNFIGIEVSPDDNDIAERIQSAINSKSGITAVVTLNGSSITENVVNYCKTNNIKVFTFDYSKTIEDAIASNVVVRAYQQDEELMSKRAIEIIINGEKPAGRLVFVPVIKK